MRFYFIRHGQSQNNALFARTGSFDGRHEDPELTDLGREQAARLGQFLAQPGTVYPDRTRDEQNLAGFGITHLYCSLMVRAVATGTIVGRALDLPLVGWPEAHELGGIHRRDPDGGDPTGLPGHNRPYFQTHYPSLQLPDDLGDEGWWNRPFEDYEVRLPRAQRFWQELLARHGGTDDRVALISHGGFYAYVLTTALDLAEEVWFSLNNAGISRLDLRQERLVIQYLNRVDFLPPEMIT